MYVSPANVTGVKASFLRESQYFFNNNSRTRLNLLT